MSIKTLTVEPTSCNHLNNTLQRIILAENTKIVYLRQFVSIQVKCAQVERYDYTEVDLSHIPQQFSLKFSKLL